MRHSCVSCRSSGCTSQPTITFDSRYQTLIALNRRCCIDLTDARSGPSLAKRELACPTARAQPTLARRHGSVVVQRHRGWLAKLAYKVENLPALTCSRCCSFLGGAWLDQGPQGWTPHSAPQAFSVHQLCAHTFLVMHAHATLLLGAGHVTQHIFSCLALRLLFWAWLLPQWAGASLSFPSR